MVFAKEGLKMIKYKKVFMVDVAQLVRAPLCGSGGRGFKSRHPPFFYIKNINGFIVMSKDYIKQYEILHNQDKSYGASYENYLEEISLIIDYIQPKNVLDYGCGKGVLLNNLIKKYPKINFYGYDPAVSKYKKLPTQKIDLIINTDVLEHIPEEYLPDVIKDISSLCDNCFFAIHHALAYTLLPNGQNAHYTVKPPFWYQRLMSKYFKHLTPLDGKDNIHSIMLTFKVPPSIIKKYNKIIKKHKFKAFFIQIFYKARSVFRRIFKRK